MTERYEQYLDWVVYQIYPKSFYDTNGDGVGDLRGVIKKLDYIHSLGVNAIWLCPIYQSPQKDNGYDISDYRTLQPCYGDMHDFEELTQKAHARGIKIIMDLVANHTSDRHVWFEEARSSRENPYHGYYYWADTPPNDWQSVFGGSAWAYNPPTGEYYLHSFAVEQPDVNWTNEKVRAEFCEIVDFWAKKGVDGFRCDVLDFISKDFQCGKMTDGPRLHEYIRQLFSRDGARNLFTVGECWSGDVAKLCGEERKELKTTFQFDHITVGQTSRFSQKEHTTYEITRILSQWQLRAKEQDFLLTLFTDNHDQAWFLSRLGNDQEKRYECATVFATMVYCLRGVPFVYQGQEIGSTSGYTEDINDFCDVETLHYYQEMQGKLSQEELMRKINFGARDIPRRPFAWNGEQGEGYGFTEGVRPWLAYSRRSGEINLEKEEQSEKSVVKYYRALFALRAKLRVLRRGVFKEIKNDENCFVYERIEGKQRLLIVCNFEKAQRIYGLAEGELLLGNLQKTARVNREYAPYEAAIYQL